MLAVLLSILKFIGLALLWIIGVILAMVLLLLLCPITYRIEGRGKEEQMTGGVRGTYLLGLIRFAFQYPEPGKPSLKILWFDLLNRKEKPKKKQQAKSEKETVTEAQTSEETQTSEDTQISEAAQTSEEAPQLDTDTSAFDQTEFFDARVEASTDSTEEKKKEKKKFDPEAFVRKWKEKFLRLGSRWKTLTQEYHFYQNLLEDEKTQGLLAKGKKHLMKILKKIFPRKIHLAATLGTGSPDTTGYAFGLYTLFAGRFDRSSWLEPDFDRKVMEGEVRAKGHFNLWGIAWHGLCVVLDRRLRLTIRRLKDHKETMEKRKDREEARIAMELDS